MGCVFWIAGIGLVLVISLSLSWCYWEELRGDPDKESLSATVRNVGVVIGGNYGNNIRCLAQCCDRAPS